MALTNPALVRLYGNLSNDIADEKLIPHITQASLVIQSLFDDYGEIKTDLDSGNPNKRSVDIQIAETLLAISKSILPLNSRVSVEGGFLTTIGFGDSESSILSVDNANKLAHDYQKRANDIILDYYYGDVDLTQIDGYIGDPSMFVV